VKNSLVIVGLGAAIAAATLCSCGGMKIPGANSATTSGQAQASGDPHEDLKKAFTAQLAAKSFRYRMNFESSFLSGSHVESEFVAPDRYHVTIIGQSSVPGREIQQEMIITGKDTFMKVGDMPWRKTEANSSETTMVTTIARMAQQFRATDVEQRMTKYEDVRFVGPETLDGSPALVYQFKLKGTGGQSSGKIWISTTDGLPRKIENDGGAGTNSNGGTTKSKLVVTYYDYNANIKIEPPI